MASVTVQDPQISKENTQMLIQDSQISSQAVHMTIRDGSESIQMSIPNKQVSMGDTDVSNDEHNISIKGRQSTSQDVQMFIQNNPVSTQDSQAPNEEPNDPIIEPKMSFQDTGPYAKHSDGVEQYRHSVVHYAVARADHTSLRQILSQLPVLAKAGDVTTEEESALAEEAADKVSSIIDRRDVPGRETPLHLAVRLGDAIAVEMLMSAGADWSLQNEQGWSALQEAVCAREEGIAMIITRYYQPMAWAKWCRRLPRITGAMQRMRDFYMEITFHFESSVIPFIGRIAPSDTYRIWKRGSNLRADMTLAGFDGFKIQRSDQSFIFLGNGTEDGRVPPGSLLVLTHKDKEVTNALEGAGVQPSDADIAQEVAIMSQTNMYRPGIDVTNAELFPQMSWRRQEKTELVGPWKAKMYDMHNVHLSVKSRRVPGAMTDEELFAAESEAQAEIEEDYVNLLNEEEKHQLESALKVDRVSVSDNEDFKSDNNFSCQAETCNGINDKPSEDPSASSNESKKRWFGWGRSKPQEVDSRKNLKSQVNGEIATSESEVSGSKECTTPVKRSSLDSNMRLSTGEDSNMDSLSRTGGKSGSLTAKRNSAAASYPSLESEYKKGLRPVLWLTPDFPLKTDELLPLLDLLAHKVKAIRRLRELLTTTLPAGTFPVKVAIPIVPTIRVVVTFNKFEDTTSDEFSTPLSSPARLVDSKAKATEVPQSSGSWLSWIRNTTDQSSSNKCTTNDNQTDEIDPFVIPKDYTWIDMKEKKRRLKGKMKNKKAKRTSLKPPDAVPVVEVDVPSA